MARCLLLIEKNTVMRRIFLPLMVLVGNLSLVDGACAFQTFEVTKIRVEGIKRVSTGAVLDDLPIHVGDQVGEEQTTEAIHALYETGFFKDVKLLQDGKTLVVRVIERPTISDISLTGIKDKEKIKKLLRDLGLAEGRFFDPAVLLNAEKDVERYYLSRGRYGVRIEPTVIEDKQGLVTIKLSIYEGDVARIKKITITGNHLFSEKELTKEFHLAKTNWLSWFTSDDQYNKEKLNADLETLRSFYMDRGYVQFQVDSSQVSLSPDKKSIFVTIQITEGDKFTFGQTKLEGKFVVPKKELEALVEPLKAGNTFSRKVIIEAKQALQDKMGDSGFSAAEAQPMDNIDESTKQVNIIFRLLPGKRMYVRRILIEGNATTKDEVLRREIPQMEGTWISNALVREGRERIMRRGFGSDVDITTKPVPGSNDQMDLIYQIEEARLGQIGAGIGYSPSESLMFNFSISQENFFGTGKAVDFTFDKSKAFTNYAVGYQDPYFTVDGIGMGFSSYYNKSDMSKTSNVSNYSTDTLGGEVRFVFPIGRFDALRVNLGYDNTHLKVEQEYASQDVNEFVNANGNRFSEFTVGLGWNYDSLDRRLFPTKGMSHSVSLQTVVPGARLQYYKATYDVSSYYPLNTAGQWVFSLSGNFGYGSGYGKTRRLPFYRYFVAGGSRYVRGYAENSLGPKDSQGRAFGGNVLVAGTASLVFPNPIKPDAKSLRTALFFDAGQVYDTRYKQRRLPDGRVVDRNPAGLRYSVGLSLTWHTPLAGAPLSFSLAKPLNLKAGEEKRHFTFWMGTQF